MLFFLHNRIERAFAATAAGVYTFWLVNGKKFLFRLTTKILLNAWMASFFATTLSSENKHTRK